ncbi:DUF6900 domain-containing protein [Endozoicomonas ascidiicola]|uniref:DUF6900 domain-containing protein n=1 Tax=Endozoicomonas ascidiicola TaxID=1698521 RepID=UPI000A58722C|nr:hypothetical protein [Endozoicomonas ascidiicola]
MNKRLEKALETIAKKHRLFDTLSERKTSEDFNEVSVWCVKSALEEAYQQGFKDGQKQ